MDALTLKGLADFSDLFDSLDAAEQKMRDFAKVAPDIKPRVDLTEQFRALDALDARLKGLSGPTAPLVPTVPQQPGAQRPVGPTDEEVSNADTLKKRLVEMHSAAAILRNDFIAAGTATNITDEEVAQLQTRIQTLQGELRELRPVAEATFGEASREVRQLSLTTAQLQRTLTGARGEMSRLGIASQFKLGIEQSGLLNNPQAAANGILQVVRFTEQARNSTELFRFQLQKRDIALADGNQVLTQTAQSIGATTEATAGAIAQLIKQGFKLEQIPNVLKLVAASGKLVGRDASDSITTFSEAVTKLDSSLLNGIGITGDFDVYLQRMAKSVGTVKDNLNEQQKAQAIVNLLTAEASDEAEFFARNQSEFTQNTNDANKAISEARQALGEALTPAVNTAAKALTFLAKGFSDLPDGVQSSVAGVAGLITLLGFLMVPMRGIRDLFGGFKREGPAAGKGLKSLADVAEESQKRGTFGKLGNGVKNLVGNVKNAGGPLANFLKFLTTTPTGKAGLVGAVATLSYGLTRLVTEATRFQGLNLNDHIQNALLKDFYGFTQEDVENMRLMDTKTQAYNQTLNDQKKAIADLEFIKDKQLKSSSARLLVLEREFKAEEAALKQAEEMGAEGQAAQSQRNLERLEKQIILQKAVVRVASERVREEKALAKAEADRAPRLAELQKLQDALASESEDIRISAKSDFARDMATIAKDFRERRAELEAKLAGEKDLVVRLKITETIGKLEQVEQRTLSARTVEELKAGEDAVADAQRDVEQARINAMKEGAAKRAAELDNELKNIRDRYGPQIRAALENAMTVAGPDRAKFNAQAGQLQGLQAQAEQSARAAAARLAEDDQRREREKAEEQVRVTEEAQRRVLAARAAAADGIASIIEAQRARELELYGNTADARMQIEQRYADALVMVRLQALRVNAQNEAAQIRAAYEQQMRAAKSAGAQRGAQEAAARAEYNLRILNLERTTADKAKEIQITAQQDVRNARLAVQQEALDRELRNIGTATGAELASLRVRLQARRAAAISRGDVQTAEQLATALRQIETLNTDRVADLKRLIREAGQGAVELRQRLTDALPKNPVQKARSEAASPFNSIIRDAQKSITDLNKAYGKIGIPTAAQTAQFRRAVAEQNGIIRAAQVERNRAVLTAEQETNRQILADRRALAREEIEAALKVAQSDQERQRLRLRLAGVDQSRLMEVKAELAALDGRANAEERIAALKREQWALEGRLAEFTEAQRQRAEALEANLLSLTQAQVDRMEALALTDREVTASREARLTLTLQELALLDQRIAKAQREKVDAATLIDLQAQRVAATVRVAQAERALVDLALRSSEQALAFDQARARAKGRILALGDDAVAATRVDIRLARQTLDYHRARLDNARDLKLTNDQVRESEEAVLNAQADIAEGERTLARAMQDRLTLALNIEDALRGVNEAGAAQGTDLQTAAAQVENTTRLLQRAREDVRGTLARVTNGQALTDQDVTRLNNLTDAIHEQREAVRSLGDEYRRQLDSIGGLSDAIANLNDTITPKTKAGGKEFSVQREIQDLRRLETRRSLALTQLERAIQAGDPEKITQTLGDVNTQEQAYRKEVERLRKEGYAPYLNLVDQQQGRVLKNVQAAQGVLDDLIADGMTNLDKAEELQKQADADSGDSVVVRTADALAEAMNSGSALLADRVLDSLASGAELIAEAVRKVQAIQITLPDVDVQGQGMQEGDVTNYGDIIINWQGQQMPTPPDLRSWFNELQRMAADEARRNPCRR